MAEKRVKKLIVVIPEELHRKLKIMSAQTGESMRNIVTDVLTSTIEPPSAYLKRLKSKKKK